MKIGKRTIVLMVSVLLSVGTWAQDMTEQEAAERALQFLRERGSASRAKVMGDAPSKPVLKAAKVEAEKIYAFNVEGGGYVIASGDSRTLPVLGYSDCGSIDWDNMPENMRTWLKQYDDAIATLGDRTDFVDGNLVTEEGEQQQTVRRAERVAIEPLVPVHWYQEEPYWNKMPRYAGDIAKWQGKVCLTGCNATAMAQIMKYYEWPKTETAAIPAYDAPRNVDDYSTTWHIDELPPVTFDWANMIDHYVVKNPETGKKDVIGTEEQQDAVATLMRYCAQSLKTEVTPVSSSAFACDFPKALVSYFGYASTTRYIKHEAFGIDEWEELIYSELAAKRPVVYGGIGDVGGHTFVCDGYDVDGLFHFNWGWEGDHDGYFALNVLNPYFNAATGFSQKLGFTFYQDAIIGIQPPSEETEQPLPLGRFELVNIFQQEDNTIGFGFKYDGALTYPPVTIDYALGTIETDGTLNPRFIGDPNDSIVYSGNNWIYLDIDPAAIQPGESLVLYPMIKRRHHPEKDWWAFDTKAHYVQAERTAEGEYSMKFVKPSAKQQNLQIVDAQLNPESGLVGKTTNMTLIIRNDWEREYINKLYLYPLYFGNIKAEDITADTPYTKGEAVWAGALLRVGEEAQITFCFVPKQNGTIIFKMYTADEYYKPGQYMDECVVEINDPTGVTSMEDGRSMMEDVWYDLQGRKLEGKPTEPGLYIHNGKKVLIKLRVES